MITPIQYITPIASTEKAAATSADNSAKPIHTSYRGKLSTGISTANDWDGDGISNANDKCADTPANAVVDADGCIIYLKKI